MARRRRWRTAVQQNNTAQPTTNTGVSSVASHTGYSAEPTDLPVADLRRVSLIVICLLAVLAGIVAYVHSGSHAALISSYLSKTLHINP